MLTEGSINEAIEVISQSVETISTVNLPLSQSYGSILAEDVLAPINLPFYQTSAMDGWAICGSAPWEVVGEIATGSLPDKELHQHQAIKIATGGIIPNGADAVLPWERATLNGASLSGEVNDESNIRPVGAECREGEKVLEAGIALGSAQIGFLAAMGLDSVTVRRTIKTSYFYLGSELILEGLPDNGKIRDALGVHLSRSFEEWGCITNSSAYIRDDLAELKSAFEKVVDESDLIITTGGTADSQFDLVKPLLKWYGAEILVDRVRMRPGFHIIIAKLDRAGKDLPLYIIALPGNPQSALVAMASVGIHVLNAMQGYKTSSPFTLSSCAPIKRQAGFARITPGNIVGSQFIPNPYIGSNMLRGIANSQGFALAKADASNLTEVIWLGSGRI